MKVPVFSLSKPAVRTIRLTLDRIQAPKTCKHSTIFPTRELLKVLVSFTPFLFIYPIPHDIYTGLKFRLGLKREPFLFRGAYFSALTSKAFLNPKSFTGFDETQQICTRPWVLHSIFPRTGMSFPAKAKANLLLLTKITPLENLQLESGPPSIASFKPTFPPRCNIVPQADLPEPDKYSKNVRL